MTSLFLWFKKSRKGAKERKELFFLSEFCDFARGKNSKIQIL